MCDKLAAKSSTILRGLRWYIFLTPTSQFMTWWLSTFSTFHSALSGWECWTFCTLLCVVFNAGGICLSLVLSFFDSAWWWQWCCSFFKQSLLPDSDHNNCMILTPRKSIQKCLGRYKGQRLGCSNWQSQSVGQVRSGAGQHSAQRRSERETEDMLGKLMKSTFMFLFEKSNTTSLKPWFLSPLLYQLFFFYSCETGLNYK